MTRSNPGYRYLRLLTLPLLLAAAWPLGTGIRILYQPTAIRSERFPTTLPGQGPYSPQELKQAESRAAFAPPEKLKEGFSREELEILAEGERKLQATRQAAWQRRQQERIQQASAQAPLGWTLLGLGAALMILWSWAGWRLGTAR